jgi:hypothetical protein
MANIQKLLENIKLTAISSSNHADGHEQSNAQMAQIDLLIWSNNSIDENNEDWQQTIGKLGTIVDTING